MSFIVVCDECDSDNVDVTVIGYGDGTTFLCLDCDQSGGMEDLK